MKNKKNTKGKNHEDKSNKIMLPLKWSSGSGKKDTDALEFRKEKEDINQFHLSQTSYPNQESNIDEGIAKKH